MLAEIAEIECNLVLVDLEMKEMNALELSSRIMKCKSNVKLVFLAKDDRCALEALQMGVTDYLIKPLTIELLQRVEKKLGLTA